MEIIFEKEYEGSILSIREQFRGEYTKKRKWKIFLFIDDVEFEELDLDEIIDYRIYNEIGHIVNDLFPKEFIMSFCNEFNDDVRTWQW